MSFFVIKIIISIHISSLKKSFEKIWKMTKKSSFYLLKVSLDLSSCTWKFIEHMLDHYKFILDLKVSKIKSLDFPPIFLTNRVWPKQAKSWKLKKIKSSFYLLKVSLDIFCSVLTLHLVALENLVWAHALEPTWSLEINFGSKGIQNQKFPFFAHLSYYSESSISTDF